ncbi:MAG TPA: alpha/beta fold hydrolase [Terriglobales bacterium]
MSIRAADNILIPCALVSSGSDKLVILSHGITTGKEEDGIYTRFAEEVLAPQFDSLRFDFRGHGESALSSTEVTVCGEVLDFMAVVRWARARGYTKLFHLGTSFGASITLLSAAHFSFAGFSSAVFWNPVISYRNTFIEPKVPWAKEFFDQGVADELAYRTGTRIPETQFVIGPRMTIELLMLRPEDTVWPASLPLLIIHGDKDMSVPHADSAEYCRRNPRVKLHTIPGVDHGFDDKVEEVYGLTQRWFKEQA